MLADLNKIIFLSEKALDQKITCSFCDYTEISPGHFALGAALNTRRRQFVSDLLYCSCQSHEILQFRYKC